MIPHTPISPPPSPPRAPVPSDTTTRGIRIRVLPRFLPEHSGRAEAWQGDRYVFAYHITITNNSPSRAKLLSRHWIIVDADGDRHEVRGEGVVGCQPDLAPGESFEYTSTCPLPTPWGTMEGEFNMIDDHDAPFTAPIARFYLVAPAAE